MRQEARCASRTAIGKPHRAINANRPAGTAAVSARTAAHNSSISLVEHGSGLQVAAQSCARRTWRTAQGTPARSAGGADRREEQAATTSGNSRRSALRRPGEVRDHAGHDLGLVFLHEVLAWHKSSCQPSDPLRCTPVAGVRECRVMSAPDHLDGVSI